MAGLGGVHGTLSLFPHTPATIQGRVYDASNATGVFSQWATLGGGSVALLRTGCRVGVGTAQPAAELDVQGGAALMGDVGVGTRAPAHRLHVEGGDLYVSGEVLALSDARHKRDLRPLGGALDRVRALTGYTYSYASSSSYPAADPAAPTRRRHVGLLAQDVARVLPEAVHEEGARGGPLSLAYGNLTALLVEAVKELAARVDRLDPPRMSSRGPQDSSSTNDLT